MEIVIVYDSSMDDSFAIARKHLQSNHSIQLIDNHINTGFVDRKKIGLHHCPGDKVFIPDADHLIDDDCLSAQLSILHSNPSKVACDAVDDCFDEPVGLRGMCPTKHATLRRSSMAYIAAMALIDRRRSDQDLQLCERELLHLDPSVERCTSFADELFRSRCVVH